MQKKCFSASGASSSDPSQFKPTWLIPHQLSLNFKIVWHLAELDSVSKFAEKCQHIATFANQKCWFSSKTIF